MSEKLKPRAEVIAEFQKAFDESTEESAKRAIIVVLDILLDIRDGLIKDEVIIGNHNPVYVHTDTSA